MSHPIRTLVAVPNRILRSGLCALLEGSKDVVLLGSAATMADAVAVFAQKRPDLLLMSIGIFSKEALNAIAEIRMIDPAAWIIGLATEENEENSIQAMRAGAAAILRTDLIEKLLLPLIRAGPNAVTE